MKVVSVLPSTTCTFCDLTTPTLTLLLPHDLSTKLWQEALKVIVHVVLAGLAGLRICWNVGSFTTTQRVETCHVQMNSSC